MKLSKIITGILLGLVIGVLIQVFFSLIPFFQNIELLTVDYRFKLFSKPAEADKNIVIVVIDQASLDYLEYPQENREPQFWPWHRYIYADILDYLRKGQPQAVIFDLTLKRKDEDGDDQFAESIQKSGNVYCPLVFTQETEERYTKLIDEPSKQILIDRFSINIDNSSKIKIPEYNMTAPPNITLLEKPKRLGSVNIKKDEDGVLRKVPLLHKYDNKFFPSLSLAVAMDILKTDNKITVSADNKLLFPDRVQPLQAGADQPLHARAGCDGKNVYLSPESEMYIWWYGPSRTYHYIPFSQLYDDCYYTKTKKLDNVLYKPEYFKDKIIFIGTIAPAHGDLHSTPLGSVYPGVEFQATALNNLLSGNCLIPATNHINWLIILLLCMLSGLFMFSSRSFLSSSVRVSLLALIFLVGACYVFSSFHYWIELVAPLGGICLTFTSATVIYYFTEGKEKRRIKTTFSKYLAPEVVEEILKDYKNLKASVGERKELTVLFSDIRNFTKMSEFLPPEEVVRLLNEYLTLMVKVIFRYGGTLDKYMGDGIMAFYGAPRNQPNHAELAVRTAREMLKEAKQLRLKWTKEGKPDLNIGIGINTGEVVVGNIGSEQRLDYTIIGDNVNLASRLETLNKEYGTNIIISQFTARKLDNQFPLRELGQVQIRGKEKPVMIYELKTE
ncbi:MAG: adenylate/guanylate cyclase domain-containing protein [Planctomycetota bacterium]